MLHDEPPTIWFDDITDITLISAIYYCIVFAMVIIFHLRLYPRVSDVLDTYIG